MSTPNPPIVYQLRIRLDRISPLIWRRLRVTDETTIAELHATIQFAFGWFDSHLHRFVIHGKSYGIAYAGGMTFGLTLAESKTIVNYGIELALGHF